MAKTGGLAPLEKQDICMGTPWERSMHKLVHSVHRFRSMKHHSVGREMASARKLEHALVILVHGMIVSEA
jgi:hypothetical protein